MEENANGATATLDADVSGWERSLDQAAERTKGWASKVQGFFESVNSSINSDRVAGFREQLQGIAQGGELGQQAAQNLSAGVGDGLGKILGGIQIFGFKLGPLGEMLGGAIGDGMANGLKDSQFVQDGAAALDGILQAGQDLSSEFGKQVGEVGADAGEMWSGIKGIIKDTDWKAILSLPADQAWAEIEKKGQEIWGQVEDFAGKAVGNLAIAIDNTWAKVQEPVAKFADFLQQVGVKLGIVQEGTASWGDAVRNVGEISKVVVGGIGFGLGYLEGLFKKLGGYIGEYVVVPLADGLAAVLESFAGAINSVASNETLKKLAEKLGMDLGGMQQGLNDWAGNIRKGGDEMRKMAVEAKNIDVNQNAMMRGQQAMDRVGGWKGAAQAAADQREAAKPPPVPEIDAAPIVEAIRESAPLTTSAILAGSREAANLQARAGMIEAQVKAQEKAAELAAEHRQLQRDGNAKLDRIEQNTKGQGVLKTL